MLIVDSLKEQINEMKRDVEELLNKYENKQTFTDSEEERRWGSIYALETLLERWDEKYQ